MPFKAVVILLLLITTAAFPMPPIEHQYRVRNCVMIVPRPGLEPLTTGKARLPNGTCQARLFNSPQRSKECDAPPPTHCANKPCRSTLSATHTTTPSETLPRASHRAHTLDIFRSVPAPA